MTWKSEIGLPKARLALAYASAASKASVAMPTACAAIPMRPPSSVVIAILKPSPSRPSRFSSGTRTSVRKISTVPEALTPSLTWCRERSKPGVEASTRNAEIPRAFFAGSVIAKSRQTSASCPQVMNTFCPEIR